MSHVFFTDRDLGRAFPQALRDAGLAVETSADHFSPTTPDATWLEIVGRRGWVALTHDKRIRYKPNERDAVMRFCVPLFVLIGAAPLPDLARNFVASQQAVLRFLAANARPFIAKVFRPSGASNEDLGRLAGSVTMWLSRAEWATARRPNA